MKSIKLTLSLLLGTAALFLIFCEPLPDSPRWITNLLLSKVAGAICAWATVRLNRRPRRRPAHDDMM